jgi:hypothetical protein
VPLAEEKTPKTRKLRPPVKVQSSSSQPQERFVHVPDDSLTISYTYEGKIYSTCVAMPTENPELIVAALEIYADRIRKKHGF